MAGAAAARRGPTPKQAARPITTYDAEGGARHRKISDAEARRRARAYRDDTDPDEIAHPQVRDAFIRGLQGDEYGPSDREIDEAHERYQRGGDNVVPLRAGDGPSSAPRASSGPTGLVVRATGSVGSAILGAFAYALLINVLHGHGKAWLSAKWTNGRGSLP